MLKFALKNMAIKKTQVFLIILNPNADFEAVQLHFGAPKEIAASYIHEQDAAALLNTVQIKKKILAIVAGTMALVLLMWAGSVAWAIADQHANMHRTIVVVTEKY